MQQQRDAAAALAADPAGELGDAVDYVTGADDARARAEADARQGVAIRAQRDRAIQSAASPGGALTGEGYNSPDEELWNINNILQRAGQPIRTRGEYPGTEWQHEHLGPTPTSPHGGSDEGAALQLDRASQLLASAAGALRRRPGGGVQAGRGVG
jgi:hypothetical protein